MDIIKSVRSGLFPKIQNWSDSHNELRYREDWWKMPTKQFIFFHPLGTKYFLFGISAVGFVMFLAGGLYLAIYHAFVLGIVPFIVAGFLLKSTILKLRTWRIRNIPTLYDLFLRD